MHPILLIEDNPGHAALIQERLSDAASLRPLCRPLEVVHVQQLDEGLQFLAKQPIALLLLDLFLPDSQGLDTFARVRAVQAKVPVVILTSLSDDPEVAQKALEMGAQDFLDKATDLEPRFLAHVVAFALERAKFIEQAEHLQERKYEELEALGERMEDLAIQDPTLPCLSRLGLARAMKVEQEAARNESGPTPVAILLSIPNLERERERLGQRKIDDILRQFIIKVRDRIRPHDHLGRIESNMFLILAGRGGLEGGGAIAHRIAKLCSEKKPSPADGGLVLQCETSVTPLPLMKTLTFEDFVSICHARLLRRREAEIPAQPPHHNG